MSYNEERYNEIKSTAPKPFIFVLMPFDEKFDDIYKYGIKGASEDAGAYAERVDEQIFTEGILERIFNLSFPEIISSLLISFTFSTVFIKFTNQTT